MPPETPIDAEVIQQDELGEHDQRRAERKAMPVLVGKVAIEAKSESGVVRADEQHRVTKIFHGAAETTVLKEFHWTPTKTMAL